MKSKTVLLSFVVSLSLSLAFTVADEWHLLKNAEFQVLFPKKPTYTTQDLETEIGQLKLHLYMYEGKEGKDKNLVYNVTTTEYPAELVNSDFTDQNETVLRNAIDGAVANVKGKLLTEKEIEIDGFPGREVRVDFQDGLAVITMRTYLVKNKMYLLQTITKTEDEPNSEIKQFMNSFKLKK